MHQIVEDWLHLYSYAINFKTLWTILPIIYFLIDWSQQSTHRMCFELLVEKYQERFEALNHIKMFWKVDLHWKLQDVWLKVDLEKIYLSMRRSFLDHASLFWILLACFFNARQNSISTSKWNLTFLISQLWSMMLSN